MSHHFSLFRIIFGSYLTYHFASLFPYAPELYSDAGAISDASLNPAGRLSPGWIRPWTAYALVLLATIGSFLFTLGKWRRTAAVGVWIIATLLFLRNNLTANPSLPYINLVLLLTAFVPSGEKLLEARPEWRLPKSVTTVAAFLLALGYTFSGLTKLSSPSWIDGTALTHILENPLARPGFFREFLLSLPRTLLQLATWGALAAEILFLPLYLFRKTRPWIWLTLVVMHIGLVACIDFADLSIGMLMIHLFIMDPKWIPAPGTRSSTPAVIGFDGSCLMCSSFMNWLAANDSGKRLSFYPQPDGRSSSTIFVHYRGKTLTKSDAVLLLFSLQGGLFTFLSVLGQLVPRFLRDFIYDQIARQRHIFSKEKACSMPSLELRERLTSQPKNEEQLPNKPKFLWLVLATLPLSSCAYIKRPQTCHNSPALYKVSTTSALQEGDVIAFYMSKGESIKALTKGKIQKLPYALFNYGHLGIVIERQKELRLFQMALGQVANADESLDYLSGKSFDVYRPHTLPNRSSLRQFVNQCISQQVCYDKAALLGLRNRKVDLSTARPPKSLTCVTLVESALQAAGVPINARHRGGALDIITPSQLCHSHLETTR